MGTFMVINVKHTNLGNFEYAQTLRTSFAKMPIEASVDCDVNIENGLTLPRHFTYLSQL